MKKVYYILFYTLLTIFSFIQETKRSTTQIGQGIEISNVHDFF